MGLVRRSDVARKCDRLGLVRCVDLETIVEYSDTLVRIPDCDGCLDDRGEETRRYGEVEGHDGCISEVEFRLGWSEY